MLKREKKKIKQRKRNREIINPDLPIGRYVYRDFLYAFICFVQTIDWLRVYFFHYFCLFLKFAIIIVRVISRSQERRTRFVADNFRFKSFILRWRDIRQICRDNNCVKLFLRRIKYRFNKISVKKCDFVLNSVLVCVLARNIKRVYRSE